MTRSVRETWQEVCVADSAYVREIYEASYRRLVTQAYAVAGDNVEAEDAVQEAFARAVAAGRRFHHVDNPEAWLRTVALNVVRRRWRRARLFSSLSPRIATPSDVPGISEDHVAVIDALRALPFQQREVIALFYLADLSVQEIATTLNVADGTVKSRLNRGRTALAGLLTTTVEADHG
jgi:RNA polymerase sigma-70 factor (ECF subfamily)